MPVKTYKILPEKYDKILIWIGLFIPVPRDKYTPDFVIADWGFASTIGVNKIPLGLIIVAISWLVKIL